MRLCLLFATSADVVPKIADAIRMGNLTFAIVHSQALGGIDDWHCCNDF